MKGSNSMNYKIEMTPEEQKLLEEVKFESDMGFTFNTEHATGIIGFLLSIIDRQDKELGK
jgi:hypothetical protein